MTLGVRASVLPPSDVFGVFIDGVKETQLIAVNAWRELIVDVPAGRHVIDFSYQYNMFSVDPMPPSPPSREGKSFSTDLNSSLFSVKVDLITHYVSVILACCCRCSLD